MSLFTILSALAGIVAGILLAARTKKREEITYEGLDRAGKITNIVLIPLYACLAPFCMFVGMLCNPAYDGFMGILGWIVSVVIASATMLCGLGLGASVALRKMGKSKLSFAVQFAGVVGIGLAVGMYCLFCGNLLGTLN